MANGIIEDGPSSAHTLAALDLPHLTYFKVTSGRGRRNTVITVNVLVMYVSTPLYSTYRYSTGLPHCSSQASQIRPLRAGTSGAPASHRK